VKEVLRIKRVFFLIILTALLMIYIVYMSINIYQSIGGYSKISLDKTYYNFMNNRNNTLALSYVVNATIKQDNSTINSFSRADVFLRYDINSSIYSVFWLVNPSIQSYLLKGQNGRISYYIVSLTDLFYNITSEKDVRAVSGIEKKIVETKDLKIATSYRYVIMYQIKLDDETTLYEYIDVITDIPLKIIISSSKYSLTADLVGIQIL